MVLVNYLSLVLLVSFEIQSFSSSEEIITIWKIILFLSISDYIRTYTFDKKIESLVKTNLMGKQALPTIVSPKLYRQRFIEAMNRYFLAVPDRWEGLRIDS